MNTSGGVVHFTGIAWAGPVHPKRGARQRWRSSPAPAPPSARPCGTAPAVYPSRFFIYHEDVDLSLRLRLAGGRSGSSRRRSSTTTTSSPTARAKWRLARAQPLGHIIRTYPGELLLAAGAGADPTELALIPAATAAGWRPQKLAAIGRDGARAAAAAARAARDPGDADRHAAEFAAWLTADLDSPFIPAIARSAPACLGSLPPRLLAPRPPGPARLMDSCIPSGVQKCPID